MSCNNSRRKYFAQLAAAPDIAPALGGAERAADTLERIFQVARNQPQPTDNVQRLVHEAKIEAATRLLFADFHHVGVKPPTHAQNGLPKRDAQQGYQAIFYTLKAIRTGGQLPELARQIIDAPYHAPPTGSGHSS